MPLITAILIIIFAAYSAIGTSGDVKTIKNRVQQEASSRNLEILRYEGFQRSSFSCHGGKVWYFMKDTSRNNIYYKVHVCLWGDELQYYYNSPEETSNMNIKI